MAIDASQVNPGSNATDFQPTTQNPQQIGGDNVQTSSTGVQPSGNGSSGQELYQRAERQENLKVQTDNYSTNTRVSVPPTLASPSNSGLITLTGALVILLAIVAIVSYSWRQKPLTEETSTDLSPEAEAVTVAQTSNLTPASTAKVTPKNKKKTAHKKKKSSKRK